LARLIYGADPRVSGTVELDGKPVATTDPRTSLASGIAYLTEDRAKLGLFLDMSISDNVNVGVIQRDAGIGGLLNFAAAARRAGDAIRALAVKAPSAKMPVGGLSGGNQQKVLIARLLETGPRVVILDEPTAVLTPAETDDLMGVMGGLADAGTSIVFIPHKLREVKAVADRITVIRRGKVVGEALPSASPEELAALMVGREVRLRVENAYPPRKTNHSYGSRDDSGVCVSLPSQRRAGRIPRTASADWSPVPWTMRCGECPPG
jgi:ribose transport system ATP-binding protein